MADAPFGVPGDVSCDGGAPSQGVVSVADGLRELADWLDAHPAVVVSHIDIDPGSVRAVSFAAKTPREMEEMTYALGGDWMVSPDQYALRTAREVAPGLVFEFFLSRAKMEEAAA